MIKGFPNLQVLEELIKKACNENGSTEQNEFIKFRNIPIKPTAKELLSTQKALLESIIEKGSYQTLDYYLAVQFRLMREDFTFSLKSAFKEYQEKCKDKRIIKYGESNFYENVQIQRAFIRGEHFFKLTFNNLPEENSEMIDRLKFGSLLCISSNEFETIHFGVIQTYEDDKLPYNEALMRAENMEMENDLEQQLQKRLGISVMDSPVYFEAYRHVLICLQLIRQNDLPFERHIVHAETHVKAPSYLNTTTNYDFIISNNQTMTVPLFDMNAWPTAEELCLDKTQVKALQLAFTHSLAIIQGPPGTGKTYIGLKILQILLNNETIWNTITPTPILIVCFTNHALDQFLEEILQFNQSLVRVGGRCKSEKLKEYTLQYLKEQNEDYQQLTNEIDATKKKMENLEFSLRNKSKHIFHENMLTLPEPDETFINQLKNQSEEFESKSGLATWLNVTFKLGEIIPLNLLDYFIPPNKSVVFKEFDKCRGTNINFLAIMNCHFNFPDDLERKLLVKLKRPCAAKRDLAVKELTKTDCMSEQEVLAIKDAWSMSLEDRWRLYRRWIGIFAEDAKINLDLLQREISAQTRVLNKFSSALTMQILSSCKIIGMTTTGAARYYKKLKILACKIVIVEEAAEVLESHLIASLNAKTQHLILIGDHQQLKPKPAEQHLAKMYKLDLSLFERLINNGLPFVTLEQQHRMRPEISSIIRKHFYPTLRDDPRVFEYPNIRGVKSNVYFINHSYFEEMVREDSPTYKNEFEAKYLLSFSEYLIQQGYQEDGITILTTYNGQLSTFKDLIKEYKISSEKLRISTVDNYQGEENDIILLSLVRSNHSGTIGFLEESNRVNVALSRAKHGLYVIGNFDLLANKSKLWRNIVVEVKKCNQIGTSMPIVKENLKENILRTKKDQLFKELPCQSNQSWKVVSSSNECNMFCPQNINESQSESHMNTRFNHKQEISGKCTGLDFSSRKLRNDYGQTCPESLDWSHLSLAGETREYKTDKEKILPSRARQSQNIIGNPKYKCAQILPCGHACALIYHISNKHDCKEKIKKPLPCGHCINLPCLADPELFPCKQIVERYLPCGQHTKLAKCSENLLNTICHICIQNIN